MIKNVVLDMGNVLLDYNPEVALEAFCTSDEEKAVIRRELFEGPEWVQGDMGLISDKDRYELIKPRISEKYHYALKQCCDRWDICMVPLDGAVSFCRYVKEHGYGIYVLSNASDAFYRYFPNLLPLDYFDGIVVSSDVHIVKPDRRIYEYLLDKYSLKAEECLFIDDRQDNVDGALAVGMQAVLFRGNFGEIAGKLKKTLIFNGSPRINGDTVSLIKRVCAGLSGEYKVIDAYRCGVSPCMDCRYCWKNEGCAISDGMQEIYEYIQECDNILIASPIYFSEITGKLLDVGSRLQTYFCSRFFQKKEPIAKKKRGAVILVGGGDGHLENAYGTACTLLHHMNAYDIYPLVYSHDTNDRPAIEDRECVKGAEGIAEFFEGM